MHHSKKSVAEVIDWCAKQPAQNQQAIVLIVGPTGSGKSGFGLQFGKGVQKKTRPNTPFDPKRQVAKTQEGYEALRKSLPHGSVIIDDESIGSGGHRRRSMSKENVDRVQDTNKGRKLRHILILIIPYLDDLDTSLLKHVHWVFQFKGIGHGVAYEKQWGGLKKTWIYLRPRFQFKTLECEKVDPDLWDAYIGDAEDELRGNDLDVDVASEERVNQYARQLVQVLLEEGWTEAEGSLLPPADRT